MTGNLVQSKLGVATGVIAMWFKGLSRGSRSDPSSTILILLSNMGGVDVTAVTPSMPDIDAPAIGSVPADTTG